MSALPPSRSDAVRYYQPRADGEAWSIPSLREPRYSQSLERGLAILDCFTPELPIRGIADVADELGMQRSTTHRYMSTLVVLGYLEQVAQRKYRLALRVIDLGMSALNSTTLREHARPYLEELCRQSSYSVSLAVLDGLEIVYIDRVRSPRRGHGNIDLDLAPGARLPSYCTAMGKVLLAYLPYKELSRAVLKELKLVRMGPNTITNKTAMREELERVSDDGLAVNDRELVSELHSIAVPVRDLSGEVMAAMALSANISMIPLGELVDQLGPHLVATADRLSVRLGYRRTDRVMASGWSAL
ncbi:MAG TPA: IclR family transcriptional regulator [Solirubrobacteraceae bacterium]|nr:IclR family transcriptional regulator [Solirubrobacteraceae bacterium]